MTQVKNYEIPVDTNLLITSLSFLMHLFQYFVIPLFLLPISPLFGLLVILPFFVNNSIWALMHEGIHRVLHPNKQVNDLLSRLLFIFYASPFHFLKLGHMSHHRFNRSSFDRSEVYEPDTQSKFITFTNHYYTLLGGLYLNEIVAGLFFLLPKKLVSKIIDIVIPPLDKGSQITNENAKRNLLGKNLSTIRIDVLFIIALIIVSSMLYGDYWYYFLLIFILRGLNISLIDNSFHYGTSIHSGHFAKNLKLSPFMSKWILNFNYHYVHHLYPTVPWIYLATCDKDNIKFSQDFIPAIADQFKGPIPLSKLDYKLENV